MRWQTKYSTKISAAFIANSCPVLFFFTCTVSSMYKRIHKCFKGRKDYIHRHKQRETMGFEHYCSLNHSIKQPYLKPFPMHALKNYNLQLKTTKIQKATFKMK